MMFQKATSHLRLALKLILMPYSHKTIDWKPLLFIFMFTLIACDDYYILNNPHKAAEYKANIRYASFSERPKTLDPARSYSSDESLFTAQIYEPPLQYHYLKRPYTLVPLAAAGMPKVQYFDENHNPLPANATPDKIAYSYYDIQIQSGIFYQPHPAFAKENDGKYYYHNLTADDLRSIYQLSDFKHTGTRELIADDYIYQIKRLAHPGLNSPILGLMEKYIDGLSDYTKTLQRAYQPNRYLDLRKYPLPGVKKLDRYRYRINIKGIYPQLNYWLAMPFFAPIPWEADYFYSQPGMKEKNLSFDWYPVGTGPYMLTENNPNRQMVLGRNPNFHGETYPSSGEPGDEIYLEDAGKSLPFINKFIFSLDKESIPRWHKFLQGYYDKSGITSDSFDQAIQLDADGQPQLTPMLKEKEMRLQTTVSPSIYYMAFNMLDDVVGGYSERGRKLRQAIAIAVDYEEFISIFLNGRGITAQAPIPPGIFGHLSGKAGINPVTHVWENGRMRRRPLAVAKRLLVEAGYPDGRDIKTGQPILLNYDVVAAGGPDDQARFDWYRKQFAKLGIQLNIRSTQYNRFQDKIRNGDAQIFSWGWLADYPDPENFLFLLYGPNGKVKSGGENAANYVNPRFDKLFDKMKHLPNGPERQIVINQMAEIVRQDSPWIWGVHTKDFILSHQWMRISKPNAMANNILKYGRLDPELRAKKRKEWNQPTFWPLEAMAIILAGILIPAFVIYRRKAHETGVKKL
jgi:ABC-type transport system substrate-binding protein